MIRSFKALADVFEFVGIPGAAADPTTSRGSYLRHMGLQGNESIIALGSVPPQTWTQQSEGWTIGQGEQAQRPSVLQIGQAALVGRALRTAAGMESPMVDHEEPQEVRLVTAISKVAERRINLSLITSPWDDTEIEVETDGALIYYSRHEALYGSRAEPPRDARPAPEQLSAMKYLINGGATPMRIFPYGGRSSTEPKRYWNLLDKL